MSFGFSVGDFLAVVQLANDLGGRFAQAPREYKAIKEEYVLNFGSLNHILTTYGRVGSLIFALNGISGLDEEEFDDQQKHGVNQVIQSCDIVLQDLDSRLQKFHILAKDSTPDWTGQNAPGVDKDPMEPSRDQSVSFSNRFQYFSAESHCREYQSVRQLCSFLLFQLAQSNASISNVQSRRLGMEYKLLTRDKKIMNATKF